MVESLYKSIKTRGVVIREAPGRVRLHSSWTLICQSGRVCTILRVMRWEWDAVWCVFVCLCVWVGVFGVDCQGYKRDCHWLHLGPSGDRTITGNSVRRGPEKISWRSLEQLPIFIIPESPHSASDCLRLFLGGGGLSGGRCYLAPRHCATLASLEVVFFCDAWCEMK